MTLMTDSTLTVSNEFINSHAEVSFKDGRLLVMLCNDVE